MCAAVSDLPRIRLGLASHVSLTMPCHVLPRLGRCAYAVCSSRRAPAPIVALDSRSAVLRRHVPPPGGRHCRNVLVGVVGGGPPLRAPLLAPLATVLPLHAPSTCASVSPVVVLVATPRWRCRLLPPATLAPRHRSGRPPRPASSSTSYAYRYEASSTTGDLDD